MKYKIKIVTFNFGRSMPEYFSLFLKSCAANPSIHWMLLTDQDCKEFEFPDNVKLKKTTLFELEKLAQKKLALPEFRLKKPYKVCDFKPAWGYLLEEDLMGYDFWGYCDYDVIFGDLKKFFTEDRLDNYDKIYTLGHFSIVRNCKLCNEAFMQSTNDSRDYRAIYMSDDTKYFEEIEGFNEKLIALGARVFTDMEYFDRSTVHQRFRNVTVAEQNLWFSGRYPNVTNYIKNRDTQILRWGGEDGLKILCENAGKVTERAISYVHFRNKFPVPSDISDSFYISEKGFEACDGTKKICFKKGSKVFEAKEFLMMWLKVFYDRKIKPNSLKSILWRIEPIRELVHRIKRK